MEGHLLHPWLLLPTLLVGLVSLGLGLWAQGRVGHGVRVVGQRPWRLGLGAALVMMGLGLGLAGPRWGLPEVPRLRVHVILDGSRSMGAPDGGKFGRTRWAAATALLDRLWARQNPGISFGLDLLTGDALPVQPPGEDQGLLRDALKVLSPGDLGSPGTSYGRGLAQVVAQVEPKAPAILLLLSDGEETLEAPETARNRVRELLKQARLPLYTLCLGSEAAQPIPGAEGTEPALSRAHPELLKALAEESGGQLLDQEEDLGRLLQDLARGHRPLPAARSRQPVHPEWGAWLALGGLALWISAAGKPLRSWRLPLLALLCLGTPAQAELPLPPSVGAWLAQQALDRGDLGAARRWMPEARKPLHRLLSAELELRSARPEAALRILDPLLAPGSPRPLPPWRIPALMLAARAQRELGKAEACQELLERILHEEPGRPEAIHNLQALLQDPPPPNPRQPPPPPPPPRPSQGARQDELEGLKQRLPQKSKPPGGVKDL